LGFERGRGVVLFVFFVVVVVALVFSLDEAAAVLREAKVLRRARACVAVHRPRRAGFMRGVIANTCDLKAVTRTQPHTRSPVCAAALLAAACRICSPHYS